MAAKKSKRAYHDLFSGILEGLETIKGASPEKLFEDKKRVEVITWEAFFDNYLKFSLVMHFSRNDTDTHVEQLFDSNRGGPLGSLTNKARFAYALGLIDRTTLKDLQKIRKIRNDFAHSIKINFADKKIVGIVKELSTVDDKDNVTAKNSHKFFKSALDKCEECLHKVAIQEGEKKIRRQKTLLKRKKKAQKG